MATVIKEFIYSGTLKIADVPIGVTALDVYLWGGAGGSGGSDATDTGVDGAAGHFVSKTGIDMTSYDGVKSIAVAVGGGGAGGMSGQEAEGGKNGQSLTGYSGGWGGSSGEIGISGSGAGGGGATTVTLFESGQSINNIELAIAGGGAGSGGGGVYSRGGAGINTNSATGNTPDSLGENGANHEGDGGGGGGGAGGADGGKGGSGAYGDAGGNSGWSGSNLVPSSGSADDGSGKTPGGTGNSYYASGIAVGGADSNPGGNGKAVLVFTIPAEGKFKVSGAWKNMTAIYTKVSGTWKRFLGGYYKVSGAWKAIWTIDILFQSNAVGFGNSDGGVTSGTLGTGGVPTVLTIPATAPNFGGEGYNFCPHPQKRVVDVANMENAYPGSTEVDQGSAHSCFIAGTMVSMADGTDMKIEDVIPGDVVKGKDGNNKVIQLDHTVLGHRKLYAFNGNASYFVTAEHPFWTTDGWKAINPEATKEESVDLYNELTGALEVGHKIQTLDGIVRIKSIEEKEVNTPDLPLYNFHVENDHSYFADRYCVHNKFTFVCTSMYQKTGLEDWKRAMAIWRLYHKKVLGDNKEVQVGYHWVFRPYSRAMRKSRILRFIGAWLARHVTNHMKNKLYVRGIDKTDAPFKHKVGKRDIAGKIILLFWQPFLTGIGGILKMFFKKQWEEEKNK
jgi:hypothetical protein